MKEAIEAVIKDLEDKQTEYDHLFADKDGYAYRDYFDGAGDGVEYALTKLKEVLAQHGTDDGSGVSGIVGKEAEQVPIEENRS